MCSCVASAGFPARSHTALSVSVCWSFFILLLSQLHTAYRVPTYAYMANMPPTIIRRALHLNINDGSARAYTIQRYGAAAGDGGGGHNGGGEMMMAQSYTDQRPVTTLSRHAHVSSRRLIVARKEGTSVLGVCWLPEHHLSESASSCLLATATRTCSIKFNAWCKMLTWLPPHNNRWWTGVRTQQDAGRGRLL